MTSSPKSKQGSVYVVAAASGTGKTSLVAALLADHDQAAVSVSHTTRTQRPNEIDGQHYFFVDRAQFTALLAEGRFIEHAEVFGNLYGTSLQEVHRITETGQQLILEIDWQGALQVKQALPAANLIFILPPTLETLRTRLIGRGQDDPETVETRYEGAIKEIAQCTAFDFLLINDDFKVALKDLTNIVFGNSAEYRIETQLTRHAALIAQLTHGHQ